MSKVSPRRKTFRLKRRIGFVKPARSHNEDWYRMVWATFKPFVLLFAFLTVILLIANIFSYQHKWSTSQIQKCEFRNCLKKKNSNETLEILVDMFRKHNIGPIAHHLSLVGLFCSTAILGNLLNDFTLSYYSAYGLSVIWTHEHYHNFRIIFNSSAILYNLSHLTHILAALSSFAFAATVLANIHHKEPDKPEPHTESRVTHLQ